MNDPAEFRSTVRAGRRATSRRLVAHVVGPAGPGPSSSDATPASAPRSRVGFVVGKSVGNSVVRHRVQRRLRHLALAELDSLAPGTTVVVRALPAASAATYAELQRDLSWVLTAGVGAPPRSP